MDYDIFDKALKVYDDGIKKKSEDILTTTDTTYCGNNLKKVKQPGVKSRKACKHMNIIDDNGIITCFDCSQQLEKGIFHDKEWRFF